jgi:hypothetical protein
MLDFQSIQNIFKVCTLYNRTVNLVIAILGKVNWANVTMNIPPRHLRIILYLRSNVVKTAISGYRGTLKRRICGTSNIKNNDNSIFAEVKCVIPTMVDWGIEEFAEYYNIWQVSSSII